jgi:hypothetical protein
MVLLLFIATKWQLVRRRVEDGKELKQKDGEAFIYKNQNLQQVCNTMN